MPRPATYVIPGAKPALIVSPGDCSVRPGGSVPDCSATEYGGGPPNGATPNDPNGPTPVAGLGAVVQVWRGVTELFAISNENCLLTVPFEPVTWMSAVKRPDVPFGLRTLLGVPEITPPALNASPNGSVPPATDHVHPVPHPGARSV